MHDREYTLGDTSLRATPGSAENPIVVNPDWLFELLRKRRRPNPKQLVVRIVGAAAEATALAWAAIAFGAPDWGAFAVGALAFIGSRTFQEVTL